MMYLYYCLRIGMITTPFTPKCNERKRLPLAIHHFDAKRFFIHLMNVLPHLQSYRENIGYWEDYSLSYCYSIWKSRVQKISCLVLITTEFMLVILVQKFLTLMILRYLREEHETSTKHLLIKHFLRYLTFPLHHMFMLCYSRDNKRCYQGRIQDFRIGGNKKDFIYLFTFLN